MNINLFIEDKHGPILSGSVQLTSIKWLIVLLRSADHIFLSCL